MQILIGKDYPKIIIPLIKQAQTNIDIFMYHWGYYSNNSDFDVQKFNLAIKSAVTRGVPVRAILHAGSPSDGLRYKNCETYNHLVSWGASVKFYKASGTLHSKLILIDKKFAVCGSHNFSKRSMLSNIETSILVEGSGDIRRLQEFFNLIFSQN